MMKRKQVNVRISSDSKKRLGLAALVLQKTQTEILREALQEYIDKKTEDFPELGKCIDATKGVSAQEY